jgi:hypothetical protein
VLFYRFLCIVTITCWLVFIKLPKFPWIEVYSSPFYTTSFYSFHKLTVVT